MEQAPERFVKMLMFTMLMPFFSHGIVSVDLSVRQTEILEHE